MTTGIMLMLMLSVDSWDSLQKVSVPFYEVFIMDTPFILGAIAVNANYYYYQYSTFSFHIIDLHCNGNEETVLNCSHNNIKRHSCRWYEHAYVICQGI